MRAFDQPVVAAEPFDVALCVGNSLSLACDIAVAGRAIGQMLSAVRRGGAVVIQVLNLWRLPDGPCVWQKCRPAMLPDQPQGQVLILKGVHRAGSRGYVELAVIDSAGGALLRSEAMEFLGFEASDLERLARNAGAEDVTFYGGYQGQAYDRQASVDLIMVASGGG